MKIVISGTVGVGKSTVSKLLKKKLSLQNKDVFLVEENVKNNPYLDFFYKNKSNWAFLIQMDFLLNRFKNAFISEGKNQIKIYDRHFFDDYIFGNLKSIKDSMSSFESNLYNLIFQNLYETLKKECNKVDYIFLLSSSFDILICRIKNRNRKVEKNVKRDYWMDLYNNYYYNKESLKFFENNSKKFKIIQTSNLSPEEVVNLILKKINL